VQVQLVALHYSGKQPAQRLHMQRQPEVMLFSKMLQFIEYAIWQA
jgi:hypothetical protein